MEFFFKDTLYLRTQDKSNKYKKIWKNDTYVALKSFPILKSQVSLLLSSTRHLNNNHHQFLLNYLMK